MSSKKQQLSKAENDEIQKLISTGKLKRTKIDDDIQKFLEDAQNNRSNQMRVILEDPEKKKKLLNSFDANHRTPLHFSAYYGSKDCIDLLLSEGSDLNITDFDGYTALMLAIKVGNQAIAEKLINSGADLNVKSKEGFSALHLAVLSSDRTLSKLILSKENIEIPCQKSESGSILHAAYGLKDMEIIQDLVKKEPKLLQSLDENDMTPLHIACAYGNKVLALELIKLGANVNAVARGGCTPLHIVADSGDLEVAKSLADGGALLKMDDDATTPISLALLKKNKAMEDILSKCKIDNESYKNQQQNKSKQKSSSSYNDKASPETLKKQGNKAFHDGDYELALHWYQLAIDVEDVLSEVSSSKSESIQYLLYSNKSACHYNMKNFKEALEDAEKCIQLSPNWPKGYLRKSQALESLNRKDEAKLATDKMNELTQQGFK
ncbi:hypothetical protein DLAC_10454 [Tieghemostelium lacteum]|uniref:Ankyrin repeat-containing protein n=1 Tax=Tieghemostelium lacteum TaxID=361077 RepID=A0A151Z5G6_TIELA|nr:hypothetical protein DLAC_10454 [Tieghemostelium lacteum]|eukprot:KYQ89210.1 hypothetical protein DLAC_10454 [Tieghemostelium lacteum]